MANTEERNLKYTIRIPASLDKKICQQMKEKGFKNKADFIKYAVQAYINGDTAPTSDTMYIPKSRVTAQYQDINNRIDQLEKKERQQQMISLLTFNVLFELTRLFKGRLTKKEMDSIILEAAKASDDENGISSTIVQRMVHGIIANEKPIKEKNGSQGSVTMKKQICKDAWKSVSSGGCSEDERLMIIREIALLEGTESDARLKLLVEKAKKSGSEKADGFLAGLYAVESDLYLKAYGRKRTKIYPYEPDLKQFVSQWTSEDGRLVLNMPV